MRIPGLDLVDEEISRPVDKDGNWGKFSWDPFGPGDA
jgi:hypothetical protein